MAVEKGPAEREGEEGDGVCLQAPRKEGRGDIAGDREHTERRKILLLAMGKGVQGHSLTSWASTEGVLGPGPSPKDTQL